MILIRDSCFFLWLVKWSVASATGGIKKKNVNKKVIQSKWLLKTKYLLIRVVSCTVLYECTLHADSYRMYSCGGICVAPLGPYV